jgi:hypothetical protein
MVGIKFIEFNYAKYEMHKFIVIIKKNRGNRNKRQTVSTSEFLKQFEFDEITRVYQQSRSL